MKLAILFLILPALVLAQPVPSTTQNNLFVSLYWETLTPESLRAMGPVDLNEERTYFSNDGLYGDTPFSLACTVPTANLQLVNAMLHCGANVHHVFKHGYPHTILGRVLSTNYRPAALRLQISQCLLRAGARLIGRSGEALYTTLVNRLMPGEAQTLNCQLYFQCNMRFLATSVLFDRLYLKTLSSDDLAPLLEQYADVSDRATYREHGQVVESAVELALSYEEPDPELIALLLKAGAPFNVAWISTRFSPFLHTQLFLLERLQHFFDLEDAEGLLQVAEDTERDQPALLSFLLSAVEELREARQANSIAQ